MSKDSGGDYGPCPACGSKRVSLMQVTAVLFPGESHYVLCFDCAAAGRPVSDWVVGVEEADELAIAHWNAGEMGGYQHHVVALFEGMVLGTDGE